MRILAILATLVFSAMVAGCASPRSVGTDSTLVQMLAKAGPPTDIRFDRNGDELWEYATGPQGHETYLVRAGADGRVKDITQLLNDEHLNKIVPGKMTKADVRNILGKPSEQTFAAAGTVWSWRFKRDGSQMGFLTVRFNPDNTVFERIAIMESSGGRSSRDN